MEHFTFVKRGYDPEEVDKYITTLEQVIKSYKDKDNAIKNAIISAQMAADNVVKNAQAEAESYKVQIGEQLVGMRGALDRQRASLQSFQSANANAIRKCIHELESLDLSEMFARIDEMDAAIGALHGLETSGRESLREQDSVQRGYQRDPMPELPPMREPMRDQVPDPRDYMREAPPLREPSLREPSREVMRQPSHYDAIHEPSRDMRGHDLPRDNRMDNLRGHDAPPRDMYGQDALYPPPNRDNPDMRPPREMAPPPHELMRDRDMMGVKPRDRGNLDGLRDLPRDAGRDIAPRGYPQDPPRELTRDIRPDPRQRSDFGRDIRRDAGRDVRSDTGRDARRDEYSTRDGGLGRLDNNPMRDMNRYYPPTEGEDDQNLLPPVASLM